MGRVQNANAQKKRNYFTRLIFSFIDFFLPKYCVYCGRLGELLCFTCSKKILQIDDQVCYLCKAPSHYGITHSFCRKKNCLDGVQILFTYNKITRALVHAVKYKNIRNVLLDVLKSKPNIQISYAFLEKEKSVAFIPIPLSRKRLLDRGYNQAEDLSNYFSTIFLYPVLRNVLVRTKETKAQSKLKSFIEKRENVKDAFSLSKQVILPKICILVDDVITSGATLTEAGAVLKMHGAKRVHAIILTGAHYY